MATALRCPGVPGPKTVRPKYGRCRTYPTPSEFTQHLQDLSNTFRIYPTPSEFIQHLQNLSNTFIIYPTPSGFTQHLQNFPNIFRFFPTFSDFSQHFQNLPTTFRKKWFWGLWTFLELFPKIPRSQKRRFRQKWFFWKKIMNYPKGHELSFDLTYLMDLLSAHLDRRNAKK